MIRIFGVNSRLDRATSWNWRSRGHFPRVVERETDHPLDDVEASDHLSDPVLDLQAGVHFEEEEVVAVGVVDELDGAGGAVVHALSQLDGGGVERGAGGI